MKHLILDFYNMAVHDKIRAIRLSRGHKQNYMAYRLGIDTANYGRMERGQTKITIERLESIAEIFEIDIKELLDLEDTLQFEDSGVQHENFKELISLLNKMLFELQNINQHIKHLKK